MWHEWERRELQTGVTKGKKPFQRHRHTLENNIKMDLKSIQGATQKF